jgi:hypothetical protein
MKRFTILLMALAIGGCGATKPYEAAETPMQKAYAISASYNVVLESARDIVVDDSVDIRVRRFIQTVEARTTPTVDELENALALYLVEKAKFDRGQTTAEKLEVVNNNLIYWLDRGELALTDLLAAIKGP